MARYEAGETLASIARTYDCSPPAISYVVSRSRARQPETEAPPPAPSATEPQLIKALPAEAAAATIAQSPVASGPAANGQAGDRRDEIWPREANGFARDGTSGSDANLPGIPPRAVLPSHRPPAPHEPAAPGNGDHRRTLHLSLGNPSPSGNGGSPPAEHQPAERQNFAVEGQPAQPQTAGERFASPVNPGAQPSLAAPDRGPDGGGGQGFLEARPTAYYGPVQQTGADGARRKEGAAAYIDQELRARVDSDIAAFLAAFDAALVEDTQESRSALREATDRLLRAGARTRIELERLEARMPLPPRNIGRSEAAWRQR